jgi:hypothetical protein
LGRRKQGSGSFEITDQAWIRLKKVGGDPAARKKGSERERAQAKICAAIKENASFRQDGERQLAKVRLKGPPQKDVASFRVAQVDRGSRSPVELNPLIVRIWKDTKQPFHDEMPSQPGRSRGKKPRNIQIAASLLSLSRIPLECSSSGDAISSFILVFLVIIAIINLIVYTDWKVRRLDCGGSN